MNNGIDITDYDVHAWIEDFNKDLVAFGVGSLFCHEDEMKPAYKKMNAIYESLEAIKCFCISKRLGASTVEADELMARARTILAELEAIWEDIELSVDPDEERNAYREQIWEAANDR